MAQKDWQFTQRLAVTAVTLALGSTANAVIVRGSMEPPYGPSLPNLGWTGFADFFVDNSCLANSNTFVWWDSTCGGAVSSGSAMGFLGGSVNLFDINVGDPGPTLQTIPFTSAFPNPPGDNGPMLGVFVDFDTLLGKNTVMGVDTLFIPGDVDAALPGIYEGPLWMYFVSGHRQPPNCFSSLCSGSGSGSTFVPVATEGAYLSTCTELSCISDPATVQFSEIPEPGTLALLLGALGGGFLARRRKEKAN